MFRRLTPLAAVLAVLALPGMAQAKGHRHAQSAPSITITEAQAAVQGYLADQPHDHGGTVTSCQRVNRTRVACGVSIPCQITAGPVAIAAEATIAAFDLGAGPELERVGKWSFVQTGAQSYTVS